LVLEMINHFQTKGGKWVGKKAGGRGNGTEARMRGGG